MSMFADPIKAHVKLDAEEEPVLLLGFVVFQGQSLRNPATMAIVVRKDGTLSSAELGSVSLDWRLNKEGKWDDLEGDTIEEIDADGP